MWRRVEVGNQEETFHRELREERLEKMAKEIQEQRIGEKVVVVEDSRLNGSCDI